MKKFILFLALCLAGGAAFTAPTGRSAASAPPGYKSVCDGNVCRLVKLAPGEVADEGETVPAPAAIPAPRVLEGYQPAAGLIAFLENRTPDAAGAFAGHSLAVIILLVLLGGLALNLTPCVLPMIPVNLAIIGAGTKAGNRAAGAVRGGAYGLGIALAYGSLGLLASLGGVAFGTIQSNPWFNAAIAVVFVILALSLLDLFFIDFQRFATAGGGKKGSLAAAFVAGALSAVLAGACVAPILIAVLLLTADGVAKGMYLALALPFLLGVGMALPWPFVGAGLAFLPKPGQWMNVVKKVFAVVVLLFAAYYAHLAYVGFKSGSGETGKASGQSAFVEATPETWAATFAAARLEPKPIFVDVWASWCKNCTAMAETTFQNETVKKALEHFTVIRLRAEDPGMLQGLPGFEHVRVNGLPLFLIYPPAPVVGTESK